MILLNSILAYLGALCAGIFVGAMLTEALVLVPMWRSSKPEEFSALHARHANTLYRYFAPLTSITTVVMVLSAAQTVAVGHAQSYFAVTAAALSLAILCIYFLYFRKANEDLANMHGRPEEIAPVLARWALWHWLRTAMALCAFLLSLLSQKGAM
jgi:uncharacterized membrane protein